MNVTKINITYSTRFKLLLFLFKHVKVNILIYIHVDLYNDSMAAMPILNFISIDHMFRKPVTDKDISDTNT